MNTVDPMTGDIMFEQKTASKNTADIFNPDLAAYADLLLKNGFDVVYYVNDRKIDFLNFHKNGQIGYVQNPRHDFNMFSFSTVHKPCTRCGTGFQMHHGVDQPTTGMAIQCFAMAPHWAEHDIPYVKKWADLQEFLAGNGLPKEVIYATKHE